MRIAAGGFQHETNTFLPVLTPYSAFVEADGWPALCRGEEMPDAVEGVNIPIAGALKALAKVDDVELCPLLWCSASPGGYVTEDAFETIAGELCERLQAALPLDGVYLDLHGAMVAEAYEDGEAELLKRVRAVVGDNVPVVISLDMHANVSQQMVDNCEAMVIYRTYPHLDMAESGERAVKVLLDLVRSGASIHKAFAKLPFLIPLTAQCTLIEPNQSIYAEIDQSGVEGVWSESYATGFPPADVYDCGPSVVVYADTQAVANQRLSYLVNMIMARSGEYQSHIYGEDEAIDYALSRHSQKPVVIADTQDNPGAGACGDTTGMIAALIRRSVENVVVAALYDPAAAIKAHELGVGAESEFQLGGQSGAEGSVPYEGIFRVLALGDGNVFATGPMYGGSKMKLGNMALLEAGGVKVVVASVRQQAGDAAILRHLGVEPENVRILVIKSSVHFRADFMRIADDIIVVASPGPNVEDTECLPYTRLRDGVRLKPDGKIFIKEFSDVAL